MASRCSSPPPPPPPPLSQAACLLGILNEITQFASDLSSFPFPRRLQMNSHLFPVVVGRIESEWRRGPICTQCRAINFAFTSKIHHPAQSQASQPSSQIFAIIIIFLLICVRARGIILQSSGPDLTWLAAWRGFKENGNL